MLYIDFFLICLFWFVMKIVLVLLCWEFGNKLFWNVLEWLGWNFVCDFLYFICLCLRKFCVVSIFWSCFIVCKDVEVGEIIKVFWMFVMLWIFWEEYYDVVKLVKWGLCLFRDVIMRIVVIFVVLINRNCCFWVKVVFL